MKTLLTSTAIAVALMGAPAFAATHVGYTYGDGRVASEPLYGDAFAVDDNYQFADGYELYEDELTMDDIEDARVVSTVSDEDIGSVEDVIVRDNRIEALVLEVGGFLGLGDANVTVGIDQVRIARNEGLGDARVYISATEEQLEGYPRYEYGAASLGEPVVGGENTMLADETPMADATVTDDATAVVVTDADPVTPMTETTPSDETVVVTQADDTVMADDTMATTGTMADGAFMRRDGTPVAAPVFGDTAFDVDPDYRVDGYEPYTGGDYNQLLTEGDVEEARLYSAITGEEIGEVEDAISENGTVSALVLDIGGFLGLGEHTITVRPDQVSYQRDPGLLANVRVYINATEEQLQAYPSYNADL